MQHATEQESFWAGNFGDEYTERNAQQPVLAAKIACWSRILRQAPGVESALELGANRGLNLHAIRTLLPHVSLSAVEINRHAADELRRSGVAAEVFERSILEFRATREYDLAFTMGVLIHIAPQRLPDVYETLYRSSRRYVAVAEYYNPSPVTLPYRGAEDRLFKRDFAGELMDRFEDLRLVDYGFVYRRDPNFPLDDITWFLMEKRSGGNAQ